MFGHLLNRVKTLGMSSDTQMQREATLDIMIWTMYADNLLALPENERLDQLARELPWHSATPPEQYLSRAIARVRDVVADPALGDDLLDDISRRLGSKKARIDAYELCREVAQSDGEIAEKEEAFLTRIKESFHLED